MKTESLKLSSVLVADGIQQRAGGTDRTLVEEYRAVWREKKKWNSLPVVFKSGKGDAVKYVLAGGFTRFAAMAAEGTIRTTFEVRPGTEIDALRYALGDNTEHGKRRTAADLRRCIETILAHPEFKKLSDRKAAELARCDPSYFSRVRREIKGDEPDPEKSAAAKAGAEKRKPAKPEFESTPFDEPNPEPPAATLASVFPTPIAHVDESEPSEIPGESDAEGADSPHPPEIAFVRDAFDRVVPGWLIGEFQSNAAAEFEALKRVRDQVAARGSSFAEGLLSRALKEMSYRVPHAVCPKCAGNRCDKCRFKGWLSPPEFDRLTAKQKETVRSFNLMDRGEVDEAAEREIALAERPDESGMKDANGTAVPPRLHDSFADQSMAFAAELLKETASILKSAARWNPHCQDEYAKAASNLAELVESARPGSVCAECEGKGCPLCLTAGFVPVWSEK